MTECQTLFGTHLLVIICKAELGDLKLLLRTIVLLVISKTHKFLQTMRESS